MFAGDVLDDVEKLLAKKSSRAEIDKSVKAGNAPRTIVLYAIVQNCKSRLSGGRFHVYRGVLGLEGQGYQAVFETALNELTKGGFVNQEQADEQRELLRQEIREWG